MSHLCKHADCVNINDVCLETHLVNMSREWCFTSQSHTLQDQCNEHDPPCELSKSRISSERILGLPVTMSIHIIEDYAYKYTRRVIIAALLLFRLSVVTETAKLSHLQ